MIAFVDIRELKNKFARLLSELVFSLNIELESVTNKLINSSLLNDFEDDEIENFMNKPNEKIIRELFPDATTSESFNDIGPIYWSGIQYINIFLNYKIPLKTILFLLPLKEMVGRYDIYHEMNDIELSKSFLNDEYRNKSILGLLRKDKNLSIRKLSLLSSVSVSSLRYFEEDNERLFNAPHYVIESLINSLDADPILFKKRSEAVVVSYNTLLNDDFICTLKELLVTYYGYEMDSLSLGFEKIKNDHPYLQINNPSILHLKNKKIIVENNTLKRLFSLAINKYIESNIGINLVF